MKTNKSLIFLFAMASGLSVANVYYAQPILDQLASDFNISHAMIGGVVTATQIGCASALLFLVPLGDRFNRRKLMVAQLIALVLNLCLVALAQSSLILLLGMFGLGLLGTAMTQGLIAYSASVSDPAEQGHVVGTTQGGVFIGLLLARVFSGGVNDLLGWRGVYITSAALMLILFYPLWKRLPDSTSSSSMSYTKLMTSMFSLLKNKRELQIRGMLAFFMFAIFNIFWSALVLPLSAPPYDFSHTEIGAFGIVGAIGALAASRAGKWADGGKSDRTTIIALLLLLISWWPISLMGSSLWMLVLGIIILDLGGQALHVTNQSLIFKNSSGEHSRLVSLYMLFYAIGSGAGAISTTMIYEYAGWTGVCVLGATVSFIALIFWWLTRKDNRVHP